MKRNRNGRFAPQPQIAKTHLCKLCLKRKSIKTGFNPGLVRIYSWICKLCWRPIANERNRQFRRSSHGRAYVLAYLHESRKTPAGRDIMRRAQAKYSRKPERRAVAKLTIAIRRAIDHGSGTWADNQCLSGCTRGRLREFVESHFEPGMTWGNYKTAWVVSFIRQPSTFDLLDPEHYSRAAHYTNVRPKWVDAKGSKAL